MARWKIALLILLACLGSAAAGFWFGFREALPLGLMAETLPRGVLATLHLKQLRSGHAETIVRGLEWEIDNGLVRGTQVLDHPLAPLFRPLWDYDVYPKYEKYAAQLADHRKLFPSPTKSAD